MRRLLTTLTAAVLAGCGVQQMGGNDEAQLTAGELDGACPAGDTCAPSPTCDADDTCQDAVTELPPTPICDPEAAEMDWEDAIELILSGQIVRAGQSHGRHVSLQLADGTTVLTCEPRLDAIFDIVYACGEPCADVELSTE